MNFLNLELPLTSVRIYYYRAMLQDPNIAALYKLKTGGRDPHQNSAIAVYFNGQVETR